MHQFVQDVTDLDSFAKGVALFHTCAVTSEVTEPVNYLVMSHKSQPSLDICNVTHEALSL